MPRYILPAGSFVEYRRITPEAPLDHKGATTWWTKWTEHERVYTEYHRLRTGWYEFVDGDWLLNVNGEYLRIEDD